MQTKAELEEEITELRLRVAELEGQVAAYTNVLLSKVDSLPYVPVTDQWFWNFPLVPTSPSVPFQITN